MQTNDVQIVRVFTTATGGRAQDNTPNEVAGTRHASFDLIIDGEAGDAVGDADTSYTLFVSAESTSGGKTTFAPQRLSETATSGKFGWADLGSNNGYSLHRVITVNAGQFLDGDVYQFTVTLRTKNGILSTQKSNEFVTI